jgi:hypothetical protein
MRRGYLPEFVLGGVVTTALVIMGIGRGGRLDRRILTRLTSHGH